MSCGTDATSDAIAGLVHGDPPKVLVMIYLRRLLADGDAEGLCAPRRAPSHNGQAMIRHGDVHRGYWRVWRNGTFANLRQPVRHEVVAQVIGTFRCLCVRARHGRV